MYLTEVLKHVPHTTFGKNIPETVAGVTDDSRLVEKDFLFFAIAGEKENGETYIPSAVARGANAVVAEKNMKCSLPVIQVQEIRKCLAQCSVNFHQAPTRHFYLTGVTGTNGKTTTVYILQHIWQKHRPGILGTINVSYPGHTSASRLTTLGASAMQAHFARMRSQKTTHVAIEITSHALQQFRSYACDFDSAVFTNLTQDHLDYHGNFNDYFSAKKKLFLRDLALSHKKNKAAIINVDSSYGRSLVQELQKSNAAVVTYSRQDASADVFMAAHQSTLEHSDFTVSILKQNFSGTTSLLGAHNMENLLAGFAVAHHSGIPIKEALQNVAHVVVPGRLERIAKKNIFVDYAHTPDGLKQVLTTLAALKNKNGKLTVVFGCGGDRDKAKRPMMAKIAESLADQVIVTSDNPRSENPHTIIADICRGFSTQTHVVTETDRRLAIQTALKNFRDADIVVIAGKGHETTQTTGNDVIDFDDRKVVQEFL